MQFLLTPYSKKIESYVWWDNAFSSSELDWLQDKAKKANDAAEVGVAGGMLNHNVRRSKISWLHNQPDTEWVFNRLANIVSSVNADYFNYDLTGFGEPLQLSNYDQSDSGTYRWHRDFGGRISRKLSLAMQLSDASEYEGGNLEIMTTGVPEVLSKQRGIIAIFPTYTLHQVTPVTQGSRQSLVTWISGPPFK